MRKFKIRGLECSGFNFVIKMNFEAEIGTFNPYVKDVLYLKWLEIKRQ